MREAGRVGAKTLSGEWTKGFSNIRHCYGMRRATRNPLLGAHDAGGGTGWKLEMECRQVSTTQSCTQEPVAGTGGLHEAQR